MTPLEPTFPQNTKILSVLSNEAVIKALSLNESVEKLAENLKNTCAEIHLCIIFSNCW